MSTPLSWTEIRVLCPQGWQELVAEAVSIEGTTGVAFGRSSLAADPLPDGYEMVRTFVSSAVDDESKRIGFRHALDRLAESSGAAELTGLKLQFHVLPPEDYANSWKKSWKPFRLRKLCVVPSWSDYELAEDELRLSLEPGGAFGSGRHATTRCCLVTLQDRLQPGDRVLDAGSGSGILSVTAALLGAGSVLGFDIDPNAVPSAVALAEDNGVEQLCSFRAGGFETLGPEDGPFDVVLGNIYSDIIQEHAGDLRARLRPGGWFAFSGCPSHHRDATLAAIKETGLVVEEVQRRGRWHTFVGTRPE